MSLMPPPARLRLLVVFAGSAASAAGILTGWGSPAGYAVPALAVAVLATELTAVKLTFGKQRWTFSITGAAIAASLVRSPRAWIVVAVAIGVAASELAHRRALMDTAFAVTQMGAAAALAAEFARSVGGAEWGAVGGMAIFWFVKNGLTITAEVATTGQRLASLIWASVPFSALHSVGASGLGILGAWLAQHAPLGLFALGIPLVLLWISYDEQETRAAETAMFAELARLQEKGGQRSLDLSAQVILTAASRALGAPDVEMVLLAHEGPVHFKGDREGIHRRRVDPEALDQPWVLNALAHGRTVSGVANNQPWCALVLGSKERPLGAILVRRQADRESFSRRDVLLARVLADQAAQWLSDAARPSTVAEMAGPRSTQDATRELGNIGTDTDPALRVLRDSANRLARLASMDGEPAVGDIVDELYAAERAVASLVGAIALATDPELPVGVTPEDIQLTGARRFDDWTTTGVMAQ